jgi:hypothetical protein
MLLTILIALFINRCCHATSYLGEYPPGCDRTAALKCEYEFLLCKLFNGPANDATTLCNCATEFYGSCLRRAGVSH